MLIVNANEVNWMKNRDLDVEWSVALDGDDHGERVADLDQSVDGRRQRSFAQLDVHGGRGRIAAEAHHLRVQHVDVERVRHRLLQIALPEAADRSRTVPHLP